MPSLRTLLTDKARRATGSDSEPSYQSMLERGKIFFYTPGGQQRTGVETQNFCWISQGCGNAVIEVWGAAGSGAALACCGAGLPGNPGAYARRTIEVFPGSFICGFAGMSCGNAGTFCFRGCSEFSALCWCTCSGCSGCMCTMGGRGGTSCCMDGGAGPYCCFGSQGYCITSANPAYASAFAPNCGTVCNYCNNGGNPPDWMALAYGGDVNCCGGFSCMTFTCCQPSRPCTWHYHVRTSAGIFSEDGVVLTFLGETETHQKQGSGSDIPQMLYALNAAARSPSTGHHLSSCWNGSRICGCYFTHGCQPYLPYGVPGIPANTCAGFCDSGIRGGHGAVRIQFLGT